MLRLTRRDRPARHDRGAELANWGVSWGRMLSCRSRWGSGAPAALTRAVLQRAAEAAPHRAQRRALAVPGQPEQVRAQRRGGHSELVGRLGAGSGRTRATRVPQAPLTTHCRMGVKGPDPAGQGVYDFSRGSHRGVRRISAACVKATRSSGTARRVDALSPPGCGSLSRTTSARYSHYRGAFSLGRRRGERRRAARAAQRCSPAGWGRLCRRALGLAPADGGAARLQRLRQRG